MIISQKVGKNKQASKNIKFEAYNYGFVIDENKIS